MVTDQWKCLLGWGRSKVFSNLFTNSNCISHADDFSQRWWTFIFYKGIISYLSYNFIWISYNSIFSKFCKVSSYPTFMVNDSNRNWRCGEVFISLRMLLELGRWCWKLGGMNQDSKDRNTKSDRKRRNTNERKLRGGSSGMRQQIVSLRERIHSPTAQSHQVHQVHVPVHWIYYSTSCHDNGITDKAPYGKDSSILAPSSRDSNSKESVSIKLGLCRRNTPLERMFIYWTRSER